MAEEFEIEILVIISLLVLSFVAAHLLRKFYIIWLPESIVAGASQVLTLAIFFCSPFLPFSAFVLHLTEAIDR